MSQECTLKPHIYYLCIPSTAAVTFEHYFITLWPCEGKGSYLIFIVFLRNPICPFCPTDDYKYLLVGNLTLTYTSEASGPPGRTWHMGGREVLILFFQSSPAEEPTSQMSLFPLVSSPSDSMPSCSFQPFQGQHSSPISFSRPTCTRHCAGHGGWILRRSG